jgi:predicted RNA-binding protein with RPS1 domain
MTNQEIKNLSDSELLQIIDDSDINNPNFKQISQLAKVDGEFRARIYQLKDDNKSDSIKTRQELIKALEDNIKSGPEEIKPNLQTTLDKLLNFEKFINERDSNI